MLATQICMILSMMIIWLLPHRSKDTVICEFSALWLLCLQLFVVLLSWLLSRVIDLKFDAWDGKRQLSVCHYESPWIPCTWLNGHLTSSQNVNLLASSRSRWAACLSDLLRVSGLLTTLSLVKIWCLTSQAWAESKKDSYKEGQTFINSWKPCWDSDFSQQCHNGKESDFLRRCHNWTLKKSKVHVFASLDDISQCNIWAKSRQQTKNLSVQSQWSKHKRTLFVVASVLSGANEVYLIRFWYP